MHFYCWRCNLGFLSKHLNFTSDSFDASEEIPQQTIHDLPGLGHHFQHTNDSEEVLHVGSGQIQRSPG